MSSYDISGGERLILPFNVFESGMGEDEPNTTLLVYRLMHVVL
ncbi:hypothetical protein [Marinilactibacillus psychrotolerans]|nr:hypothetical protein [Marinilactibacillus psychrotolerans]GEL67595.1 hypothetical protein MPS01_17500 [Marinilactibacillus psychrotolerans]